MKSPLKPSPVSKKKVRRVVLGEGYLWPFGANMERVVELGLCHAPIGTSFKPFDFPKEWFGKDVPRVRLVAEIL